MWQPLWQEGHRPGSLETFGQVLALLLTMYGTCRGRLVSGPQFPH